jgi:FkbM family methyltransferase
MKYKFEEWEASCQIETLGDIYEQYIGYKEDGFFVDIGAFDGWRWSNTAPLVEAGWRGIMVEPSPVFDLLQERLGKNEKISLVASGIGIYSGEATFYLGDSESTFLNDLIATNPRLSYDHVIKKHVMTMNTLLSAYDCPEHYDVLSVDVEGCEIGVLGGYDLERWRPKLAIVEMDEHHAVEMLAANAAMILAYFYHYGYGRIYYDDINSVFAESYHD